MEEERRRNDQELARRAKLERYRQLGVNPYGQRFETNLHAADVLRYNGKLKPEEVAARPVFLAGRIVLLRKMGKASFFHLLDRSGKIQCYIREDEVGEKDYKIFKLCDLGDVCGVKGVAMKTKTGEITLRVIEYVHLSKALKPLPDKFHGLVDKEERYRKRYLDLIVNEDARRVALARPLILRELRRWFDEHGYLEVETPILQPILGGANARPFITHHNALDEDFYLRIATELELKRLVVGGIERVYEVGRIFRNEGIDLFHNPEFTTVEAYQAFGDLSDMMRLCEDLIRTLARRVAGTGKIRFNGADIDLEKKFRKVDMTELIQEKTGVDFHSVSSLEEALALAKKFDVPVEAHFRFGHVVNAFFDKFCEADLIQPVFVCHHPLDVSPLASKSPADPRFVERFELYAGGHEMANAFTELNDPDDQLSRFQSQLEDKEKGDEEAGEIDYDYVDALEYGLAPTGGIGIGVDRLVMLLTSEDSIREVILFPTLRRKLDVKAEEEEVELPQEESEIHSPSEEEAHPCGKEESPELSCAKKSEEPKECVCCFELDEKEFHKETTFVSCCEGDVSDYACKIPSWSVNSKDLMDRKVAFHSRLLAKKKLKKPRWIKY